MSGSSFHGFGDVKLIGRMNWCIGWGRLILLCCIVPVLALRWFAEFAWFYFFNFQQSMLIRCRSLGINENFLCLSKNKKCALDVWHNFLIDEYHFFCHFNSNIIVWGKELKFIVPSCLMDLISFYSLGISHGSHHYEAQTLLVVAVSAKWTRGHVLDMSPGVSLQLNYFLEGPCGVHSMDMRVPHTHSRSLSLSFSLLFICVYM